MLEINNLEVCYGDTQILYNISLRVNEGEIVALLGSNGSGKTTLAKTIAGLVKPRAGNITLNGSRIDKLPPHKIVEKGLSLVPEGRMVFPHLSVLENLLAGATVTLKRKGNFRVLLDYVFEVFPVLRERQYQLARTLSGGEQQMLAIGRALMCNPKILILDEPSLGLAPIVVQAVFRTLKKINEDGLTILLIEQNAFEALRMSNRAYVMETGKIVGEGTPNQLFSNELLRKAYFGLREGGI